MGIIFLILFLFPSITYLFSQETGIDQNLQNLRLSGFFRTRGWHARSETVIDDLTSDGEKQLTYQDLFFRNRLELKIIPDLFVHFTFDIFNVFGEEAAALGNNDVTMKTRSIYFSVKFNEKSKLSIGLQPFSLSGGYVLARDGAGIKYQHRFFRGKVNPYFYWIKAYDNSREESGDGYGKNDYSDDDIYVIGTQVSYAPNMNGDFYYAYEWDRQKPLDTDDPGSTRTGSLNWIGTHNNWILGNWNFQLGGIYNWGIVHANDGRLNNRSFISAALYESSVGYQFRHTLVSLVSEGATGDASDEYGVDSFQQIKASHGFSNIFVDNSGGIAFRSSGDSPWYGLYGFGLKLDFALDFAFQGILRLQTKLLHFQSTHEWNGSKTMGEEWDFRAEYVFYKKIAVYFESGIFWPMAAYRNLNQSSDKSGVVEIMIGTTIRY